ncbi:hypothetical protein TSMEX_004290 [Taenia solium]|eukprot:TsM_000853300 transcript=TsM_000853300 gene=TsM_000853300
MPDQKNMTYVMPQIPSFQLEASRGSFSIAFVEIKCPVLRGYTGNMRNGIAEVKRLHAQFVLSIGDASKLRSLWFRSAGVSRHTLLKSSSSSFRLDKFISVAEFPKGSLVPFVIGTLREHSGMIAIIVLLALDDIHGSHCRGSASTTYSWPHLKPPPDIYPPSDGGDNLLSASSRPEASSGEVQPWAGL